MERRLDNSGPEVPGARQEVQSERCCEGKDEFEVVVVGSGFGGCIAAIELGKVFKDWNDANDDKPKKEVLILERGIWYMSPEAWLDPENKVAKFVNRDKRPYRFWVMPDNSKGSLNTLGMLRAFPLGNSLFAPAADSLLTVMGKKTNPMGLYDVKNFSESFALVSSGVGGGSLVYSNVTISPEPEVLDVEYKEKDRDPLASKPDDTWKPRWKIRFDELEPYMMYAKYKFIEVSKIYSVQAGYYNEQMMLPKTREIRDAAYKLKNDEYEVKFEFTDLSITEAPSWDEETKKYKNSNKFCRRQGRCNFGCLPGARHSLNKKLVDGIEGGLPIHICELADVSVIEPINGGIDGYRIHYKDWKDNRYKSKLSKKLILAAGTFGTTGLLLRSREKDKQDIQRKAILDGVSDSLGTSLSLNGDAFGFVIDTRNPVFITRGPIDTADVRFVKDGKHFFTIEDATIPRMVAGTFAAGLERYLIEEHEKGMAVRSLQEKMTRFEHHLGRLVLLIWAVHPIFGFAYEYFRRNNSDLNKLVKAIRKRLLAAWGKWGATEYGSSSWLAGTKEHDDLDEDHTHRALDELEMDHLLSRVFFFACMGIDSANGKARWDPHRERLDVNWGGLANDPIYKRIRDGMEMLGDAMVSDDKKSGNKAKYLVLDPMKQLFGQQLKNEHASKLFALHPLGGCPMETEGRKGAVNVNGELLKNDGSRFENLYVVDGSIIPTALAVNPSLTISGIAFKIIDNIITELYDAKSALKRSVEKGGEYSVTVREYSKRGPTYAVGTVESGEQNLVYIEGTDLKERIGNDLIEPVKVKVRIERVECRGRIAYGKFLYVLKDELVDHS